VAVKPPPPALSQALIRLRLALGALEAAAERRVAQDQSKGTSETELSLMQDDRARLATELDLALARAERLAAIQREVDDRLALVMGSIQHALGGTEAK
jgi:hypothetical protein